MSKLQIEENPATKRQCRKPGSHFVLQKELQQLERHLVVDDAPRVARNAPRAEVLDDGLDIPVRVHARTRQKFIWKVGVELRPVDAVLARAAAASERRARGDDGVAVAVARREEHGDAAPEERIGDGRRRRRDVRRDQYRKLAPEVARQPCL